MIFLNENPDDEKSRKICSKLTEIIAAYQGPDDLPQVQLDLAAFLNSIQPHNSADDSLAITSHESTLDSSSFE